MKKLLIAISFLTSLHSMAADADTMKVSDTTREIEKATHAVIEEIIEKKEVPKEKVEYLSQLTRYGFKNLFNRYNYNSTLPYSSQVNPNAEFYMQDYLRTHTSHLTKMKSWGTPYFTLIDNIFSQYGLPRELKYLAVIESNLQTSATSWVGAGGPWQFMPYTARDYGLVVNGNYDERRDYYKSTHAAARYLLTLYRQLDDWLLVIAAYNGGPGRVFSAIKKSGSRNFWDLQYYLPEESRNHVKKFIATHYIMEGAGNVSTGGSLMKKTGLSGENPYDNNPNLSEEELSLVKKHTISGKYNSVVIAKNLTMEISDFNRYNPGFDQKLENAGQYDLLLPTDKMDLFLANRYQILNECVQLLLTDVPGPATRTVYNKKKKG